MDAIRLRTIEEVADTLRVSATTVYQLAQQGKLRGNRVGRQWRFTDEQIREYLESTRETANA
jgi:excisionase family DNA binding protein